jgi:muramidase (phage lysozyme)
MDPKIPAPAAALLDFIGDIEAPEGYDTIYGNNQKRLHKPITQMTLDELIAKQREFTKKYKSSASGRYQFMRNTLIDLKEKLNLTGTEKFTPNFQDRLGLTLLIRRGYRLFIEGKISRIEFGKRLAQEWASLPVLRSTKGAHRQAKRGQSYYVGDALNKSLISPSKVEAVLDQALVLAGKPQPAEELPPEVIIEPVDTYNSEEIESIQSRLRDLGYFEVGEVDGHFGKRTRSAIMAFRSENGLPMSSEIDDHFLVALMRAKPRVIAPERANAELEDVKDSPILKKTDSAKNKTWWAKILTWLGIGGGVGTGLIDETLDPDQVSAKMDLLDRVGYFLADNWWVVLIILAAVGITYYLHRTHKNIEDAEEEEVQAYREGRHL